jgi:hypothetical protein
MVSGSAPATKSNNIKTRINSILRMETTAILLQYCVEIAATTKLSVDGDGAFHLHRQRH